MPTNRQLDDRISRWLEVEAPMQLPDRVLRATIERTRKTRQQAGWQAVLRRTQMNRLIYALGGAAVVLVIAALALGIYVNSPTPGVGGPSSSPTASPEASPTPGPPPTPEPSVAEPSSAPEGLLPEGPHVLSDGEPLERLPTLRTTVTIPAPDWYGEAGAGILIKNDNSAAPDGAGMIIFFGDLYVYGDPCQWATTRPDEPATTVDELVAALAAQASRDASEPVDIAVDGYAGKSITLHVPEDAVFGECDRGTFGSWGMDSPDLSPFRYHQDPGQIDKLWIVDVDGELVVIDIAYYEGTPQAVVDEMHAIVESTTFE